MKLENTNDQLMAIAAHRYCLGRQSYIVGSCLEWVRSTWPQMETNTQNVLLRDTAEALMDGYVGSDYDARGWRELLAWGMYQASEAQQAWVREAVAWKGKPWPLDSEKREEGPNDKLRHGGEDQ